MISIHFQGDFDEVSRDVFAFAHRMGYPVVAVTTGEQSANVTTGEQSAGTVSEPEPYSAPESAEGAAPAQEPRKRTRRTKAEMEAARAAMAGAPVTELDAFANPRSRQPDDEEIAAAESAPEPFEPVSEETAKEPPGSPPASTPDILAEIDALDAAATAATFEDVEKALRFVCEAEGCGVAAARKLLDQNGIKKLRELNEAEWPRFIGACYAKVDDAARRADA